MLNRLMLLSLAAFHTPPDGPHAMSVEEEAAPAGGGEPPKVVETHEVEVFLPETPASFFRSGTGKPREDEVEVDGGFRRFSNTSNDPRKGETLVREMGPPTATRQVRPKP